MEIKQEVRESWVERDEVTDREIELRCQEDEEIKQLEEAMNEGKRKWQDRIEEVRERREQNKMAINQKPFSAPSRPQSLPVSWSLMSPFQNFFAVITIYHRSLSIGHRSLIRFYHERLPFLHQRPPFTYHRPSFEQIPSYVTQPNFFPESFWRRSIPPTV